MVEEHSYLLIACNNDVKIEVNVGEDSVMFSESTDNLSTPFYFTISKNDWDIIAKYVIQNLNKKEA